MSHINKLVNVTISISESVANAESFNNILLVGSAPSSKTPSAVAAYSTIGEIAEAGWVETDAVYKAAALAFKNGAGKLYVAIPQGEESITETLNRALETTGWYGFAVILDGANSELATIAGWADTNSKLFAYTVDCSEKIENPVAETNTYSFGFASKNIAQNAYTHIAVLAKVLTLQPGSETWAYKTVSGIVAEAFTTTEIESVKEAHLNCYVNCAGKDITLDGKTTSGEWIDVIRFRDWLLNDMQTRIYSLFIKNAKVPYSSAGVSLIQNQMIASLKQGQSVGGIAETEYDAEGVEIPGFTTTVPTALNVTEGDKKARTLAGCSFTARLANAIHLVEIKGSLTV